MSLRVLSLSVAAEVDVVASRQRARQIAALCGFGTQDQARIATAVSELARNVYNYANSGRIEFAVEGVTAPQVLVITIEDRGPGIADLDLVLSGRYQSRTGMGLGLIGARRLMDQFDIRSAPGQGVTVTLKKLLPPEAPLLSPAAVGAMGAQLHALPADVALSEMRQQNKELLATLAELKARQDELVQLTRELEDTNRGVVALYAELDQQADHLRRADEMKTRFLSNMSHEFRTPLSSIRALSKLLLGRADGDLGAEQERQVGYILKSADSLSELVDDLLDLAKIEAGKIDVHAEHFDAADMFSALRGMLRPLLVSSRVELLFDMPPEPLRMNSDEAKLSQILRNFISNALKFTEQGQVRVWAEAHGAEVRFLVRDSGIGIAPEHQHIVFEEFSQLPSHLQRHVKGTGLGLPLCRKLAALLGGSVGVVSAPGEGSTFHVTLPRHLAPHSASHAEPHAAPYAQERERDGLPVLIVEDDATTMVLYRGYLRGTPFRAVCARSLWEAEQAWNDEAPAAVILDLRLNGSDTWRWLAQTKNDERRKHVPILIASELADRQKAFALGAEAYLVKPLTREDLLVQLRTLCTPHHRREVL
ncbi:ATP-binding protein [Pseudoduganella namucuonensis]|uniref:histidine kinase n=1 Tax=Pseudoduganella namucuonensis TaxID=1035707 RepID=A0A1I7HEB7_9BURK|nr:ATP-binding protein [Pseudoduganella namucuonensis]SFU59037.1 Signal transduction histidine kinase [Pseudoduganella namucuonensis]